MISLRRLAHLNVISSYVSRMHLDAFFQFITYQKLKNMAQPLRILAPVPLLMFCHLHLCLLLQSDQETSHYN